MATYYVDATNGDNAKDGLSEANAWKTVAKVNAADLQPGDAVLFKRGETWIGTSLTIPASGEAGSPIRFADYGSGAKPIIDGNDAVVPVVANGKSYLEFENIEVTQGVSAGFSFTTCSYVDLVNCHSHDNGNDGVLFMTACHHCTVTGGEFYNGYQGEVGAFISGLEIADGGHDITFRDVKCYDNDGQACGITIHSHDGTELPYNLTIEGAECYGNAKHGIQILKQDDTADEDRNIVLRRCHFHDNTEAGLRIYKAAGASNYPDGITVERCECYGNGTYALFCQADNVTVRHSVFADTDSYFYEAQDVTVYNCTFHNSVVASGALYWGGARSANFTMRNCIIQCEVLGQLIGGVYTGCGVTGWDVDYNLWRRSAGTEASTHFYYQGSNYNFADWKTQTGGDAHSEYGDASFVDAENDNYHVTSDSPAVDAGTDVGLPYAGSAPDIGAHEYAGVPGFGGALFPGRML
jgi:hypothetical protein